MGVKRLAVAALAFAQASAIQDITITVQQTRTVTVCPLSTLPSSCFLPSSTTESNAYDWIEWNATKSDARYTSKLGVQQDNWDDGKSWTTDGTTQSTNTARPDSSATILESKVSTTIHTLRTSSDAQGVTHSSTVEGSHLTGGSSASTTTKYSMVSTLSSSIDSNIFSVTPSLTSTTRSSSTKATEYSNGNPDFDAPVGSSSTTTALTSTTPSTNAAANLQSSVATPSSIQSAGGLFSTSSLVSPATTSSATPDGASTTPSTTSTMTTLSSTSSRTSSFLTTQTTSSVNDDGTSTTSSSTTIIIATSTSSLLSTTIADIGSSTITDLDSTTTDAGTTTTSSYPITSLTTTASTSITTSDSTTIIDSTSTSTILSTTTTMFGTTTSSANDYANPSSKTTDGGSTSSLESSTSTSDVTTTSIGTSSFDPVTTTSTTSDFTSTTSSFTSTTHSTTTSIGITSQPPPTTTPGDGSIYCALTSGGINKRSVSYIGFSNTNAISVTDESSAWPFQLQTAGHILSVTGGGEILGFDSNTIASPLRKQADDGSYFPSVFTGWYVDSSGGITYNGAQFCTMDDTQIYAYWDGQAPNGCDPVSLSEIVAAPLVADTTNTYDGTFYLDAVDNSGTIIGTVGFCGSYQDEPRICNIPAVYAKWSLNLGQAHTQQGQTGWLAAQSTASGVSLPLHVFQSLSTNPIYNEWRIVSGYLVIPSFGNALSASFTGSLNQVVYGEFDGGAGSVRLLIRNAASMTTTTSSTTTTTTMTSTTTSSSITTTIITTTTGLSKPKFTYTVTELQSATQAGLPAATETSYNPSCNPSVNSSLCGSEINGSGDYRSEYSVYCGEYISGNPSSNSQNLASYKGYRWQADSFEDCVQICDDDLDCVGMSFSSNTCSQYGNCAIWSWINMRFTQEALNDYSLWDSAVLGTSVPGQYPSSTTTTSTSPTPTPISYGGIPCDTVTTYYGSDYHVICGAVPADQTQMNGIFENVDFDTCARACSGTNDCQAIMYDSVISLGYNCYFVVSETAIVVDAQALTSDEIAAGNRKTLAIKQVISNHATSTTTTSSIKTTTTGLTSSKAQTTFTSTTITTIATLTTSFSTTTSITTTISSIPIPTQSKIACGVLANPFGVTFSIHCDNELTSPSPTYTLFTADIGECAQQCSLANGCALFAYNGDWNTPSSRDDNCYLVIDSVNAVSWSPQTAVEIANDGVWTVGVSVNSMN